MRRRGRTLARERWLTALLALAVLALVGCSESASGDASAGDAAATIQQVDGTDLVRVTLAPGAAERLGLEMGVVRAVPGGGTAVPYAAVVYDPNGKTWVYTSPKDRTFVREPITVTTISGDEALLSSGPEVGTEVVTVGTAELYGAEQEIGA
jgi:ABC-type oligopeptide transport system substrate-binding subunit